MVTLKHEKDFKFLYGYKYGRKLKNEKEDIQINSDLTRTEREDIF